jgi:hypothetical protein
MDKQSKKHLKKPSPTLDNKDEQHGPTKNWRWTQVLVRDKQSLPLIRHPPCYSDSQDILDINMRKETQITNKTSALLQTRGKDELKIIFMRKS